MALPIRSDNASSTRSSAESPRVRGFWRAAAIALTFACAGLLSAQAPADKKSAALAGTVRDARDRPVSGAELTVDSLTLSVFSDDSGRFHLGGIPPGRHGFLIRKLGYSPASFETILSPDSTLVVSVKISAVQALDAAVVSAEGRSARLALDGFYERQKTAIGTYLSPDIIEAGQAATRVSDFLRGVRGIQVRCQGTTCRVRSRTPYPEGPCMWHFVDGRYVRGEIDEVVSVSQVYAMEIYEHNAMVPSKFQGPMPSGRRILAQLGGGCGAIAIWTRSREP